MVGDQAVVTDQPPGQSLVNGQIPVTVEALDADGKVDSGYNGNVTIAVDNNPGDATLGGMLTEPAIDGVATFSDLTVDRVGQGYTLQASADGLTHVTTKPFDVFDQAAVTLQPQNPVLAGSPIVMTVEAQDANGQPDPNYDGEITIAIDDNPGNATLGGTLTKQAVNGSATFSNLTLDEPVRATRCRPPAMTWSTWTAIPLPWIRYSPSRRSRPAVP